MLLGVGRIGFLRPDPVNVGHALDSLSAREVREEFIVAGTGYDICVGRFGECESLVAARFVRIGAERNAVDVGMIEGLRIAVLEVYGK